MKKYVAIWLKSLAALCCMVLYRSDYTEAFEDDGVTLIN